MIYLKLFWEFFIVGAFTFGGGYAMIPLIQEMVLENGWLSEQQLIDFIAVSESTPGPLAVNMSSYIGMRTGGFGGAFVATTAVVLPSFIIILIISGCYNKFKNSKLVNGAMMGLRPAVVALIFVSLVSIAESTFNVTDIISKDNIVSVIIVGVTAYMCYKKMHPIMVIGVSALIGVISGFVI